MKMSGQPYIINDGSTKFKAYQDNKGPSKKTLQVFKRLRMGVRTSSESEYDKEHM